MSVFDAKRKALQQTHRLVTADLSQVCDGRNWLSFRDGANQGQNTTTAVKAKSVDWAIADAREDVAVDQLKSISASCYTPDSSCDSSASLTKEENQDQEPCRLLSQRAAPELPAKVLVATTEKADTQVQGKLNQTEQKSRRRDAHRLRRLSSTVSLCHSDENKHKVPGSVTRCRSASEGNTRHHHSLSRGNQSQDSSLDKGHRRQRQPADKSNGAQDSNDAAKPANKSGGPPRVSVRKLSEPMHRCTVTNRSLPGILRSARYSSSPTPPDRTRRRSSSSPRCATGERALEFGPATEIPLAPAREDGSVSDDDDVSSLKLHSSSIDSLFDGHTSMLDLTLFKTTGLDSAELKCNKAMLGVPKNDANWVASGVNFSKSMEVYLFKT